MARIQSVKFPASRLAVAMVILGTVGAFATEAGLDAITTVFWRCVFGTVFLAGWCVSRGYLAKATLVGHDLKVAGLGGICMVLSWSGFFAGFAMTSIATTTIVYHSQPFFVVLLGAVFFKERITLDQALWMVSAFVGVGLASGLVAPAGQIDPTWVLGIGLTLGAAWLYACAAVLAKSLRRQRPEVTALCQTTVGIALLAPFADLSVSLPVVTWGWLIGIGVLHTGIAYVLMYSAYPSLTTPVIGALTFIYPLVAIVIDWLIYDHPLGIAQALGVALIVVGTLGVKLGWRTVLTKSPQV